MKNKGFTLVELLAVLAILSVVTLIAVPTVDLTIKKQRENLYKSQIRTIKDGMKTFGVDNVELLPKTNGDVLELNIGFLKVTGFLDEELKNPKTRKCFPNDIMLTIKRTGNNYEYFVDEESGTVTDNDCKIPVDKYQVLTKGSFEINIKKGESLGDLSLYVFDNKGEKIRPNYTIEYYNSSNTKLSSIDTYTAGKYLIKYSIESGSKLIERPVTINN